VAARGIELSRAFYHSVVESLLRELAPGLHHSAAMIGPGSEVLGYDDAMSTDHHWGPRVLIFCDDESAAADGPALASALAHRLPPTFRGLPTNFTVPDAADNGTQLLEPIESGPVNHRVEIVGLDRWFGEYLGLPVGEHRTDRPSLDEIDWLTLPQQKLLTIAAGEVFRDDRGRLESVRSRLAWYPEEVWRYLLASAWARIGQEEHLVGRAGWRGDEIGARLIAARLVRDAMRLCFLMERRYAPYAKWFGTAFRELASGPAMEPRLRTVTDAADWRARDRALVRVYDELAAMHNRLGITRRMPDRSVDFFGRPFHAIAIHGFAGAILDTIHGSWLSPTMRRSPIGGIDNISDNTDLLEDPAYRNGLRVLLTVPGLRAPGASSDD